MVIHQVQVSYVVAQDRLLVRLNTRADQELRLWLTRRMVKNLFLHMLQASGAPTSPLRPLARQDGGADRALAKFRRMEALQQADFQTPFKAQASSLPIGQEPLLATTIHVTPLDAGNLRVGFEEKLEGSQGSRCFEVTLGPPLLHGFMHLLELALKEADWGLLLSPNPDAPASSPLDAFASAEPPRYLN